ncbi:MAG: MBL fold metallo-hydrolase [Planctomycetota bacterium]
MQVHDRIHIVASGAYGCDLTHPSDCHAYLIDGGSEWAMIDAGAGVDASAMVRGIAAAGVDADRLRHALVSHAHADHAGGAAALREQFGLDVHASPEVAAILRSGDEQAAGVDIGKAQGSYAPDYVYRATEVAGELVDGDRVQVGDVTIEAIVTPGHSIGHRAYLVHSPGRRDLFTGDTLFFGGEIILQNTWDCDLRAHLDSLRHLAEHDFDGLFPGHLTFSLRRGRRHLEAALASMDRGGVPPSFG